MKKNRQNTALITLILSALFFIFLLVSPFYHLHETGHGHSLFHSHGSALEVSSSASEGGHLLSEPEENHIHFTEAELQKFVSPNRIAGGSNVYAVVSVLQPYFSPICLTSANYTPPETGYFTLQDSYVHSSSNLSPPVS
ncbi:MAG: hypothetical protein HRU80_15910 [Ignavibacteriales bacterium]|nr:hypothetical protein [Ignavibacteriaceae bacterium]QOJ30275.1 MAG: hypothetical protein HRU80_15910 [Ignavibacteriales bacterium]